MWRGLCSTFAFIFALTLTLSRWAGEGTVRRGGKYGTDLLLTALFRIFPLSRWRERAGVRARAHHPSNSMQEAPHVIV